MPLSQMMQDWRESGLNPTSVNLVVFRVAWRLGQKAGLYGERMREVAEVEYIVNCMAEGDDSGCGSKTDLGRDLEREVQKLYEQIASLQDDAERYRWLREQHWNESTLAVVCEPKKAVKLGYDCPSGERLDEAIDAAMSKGGDRG